MEYGSAGPVNFERNTGKRYNPEMKILGFSLGNADATGASC
jgi:hypothetical protein